MSFDWVGLVTIVFGACALFGPVERTFQILIVSILFQASSAVAFGNNNITPPHLLVGFTAVSLQIRGGMMKNFEGAARCPNAGFWLTLFAAWCVVAGLFLPRIFIGMIDVFPIAPSAGSAAFHPEPLAISGGNVTQALYVLGSLFVFLAVRSFSVHPKRTLVVCNALILFSLGNVFFASFDIIGFLVGRTDLLDPIHNAGYVMHTNEVVAGFHRISGSFSEAAAFSFMTLGSLPFTVVLFLNGYRPGVTLTAAICQFAFLLTSTSTTAYVGLIAVAVHLMIRYGLKAIAGTANNRETIFVAGAPVVVGVAVLTAFLDSGVWNGITAFLDTVIFDKSISDSAMERAALNAQAIGNFGSTLGFGAGTGSVRASSFPLALLANVGLPGALLYGAFLIKVFYGDDNRQTGGHAEMIREGARSAVFGMLAAATISGTLVDMGLLFFVFAGLACSIDTSSERSAVINSSAPAVLSAKVSQRSPACRPGRVTGPPARMATSNISGTGRPPQGRSAGTSG